MVKRFTTRQEPSTRIDSVHPLPMVRNLIFVNVLIHNLKTNTDNLKHQSEQGHGLNIYI